MLKRFFPPTEKERRRNRERGNKEQQLRKSEESVRELKAAKVSVPSGHLRPAGTNPRARRALPAPP